MQSTVIALDQGTTSSRAIVFDTRGQIVSMGQKAYTQHYPKPGWVEHDPLEILDSQLQALREAVERAGDRLGRVEAIGITNQRETTLIWDGITGRPVYPAIVWQCRRTADFCSRLKAEGAEPMIRQKTGLLADAYFSGSKIRWILDNVPGARRDAQSGKLRFGTVDSWLIWNLTGGRVHVSDYSNCSRTMLFDIDNLKWDEDMCRLLDVPMCLLPQPVPSAQVYGCMETLPGLERLAGVPICGCAGDQAAALFGQGCLDEGEGKNTYGTGCFLLINTGARSLRSDSGLLTSVGWCVDSKVSYALEGSVFNAGSAVQWLRDELGLVTSAEECSALAASVPDAGGAYLVPAFTGLGAPYWDMYARGVLVGLTRGTGRAQLARAVIESIAYQTADLMGEMERTVGRRISVLKVDGGASRSDVLMQFQADLLRATLDRPAMVESTAWGAASLAGLAAGVWESPEALRALRTTQQAFRPASNAADMARRYAGWKRAVARSLEWESRDEG